MRTQHLQLPASVAVVALLLSACGADVDDATDATSPDTTAPLATAAPQTTVSATTAPDTTTGVEDEQHEAHGDGHDEQHHDDEHDHEYGDHDAGSGGADGDESDFAAPDGATEVPDAAPRLLVADGNEPTVQVVDLVTEETLATMRLPGTARVYEAGRYVVAAARSADRVEVIDSGTWSVPHGDHFHHYVSPPESAGFGLDVDDPTHVVDHEGLVAVFNDGDGTVSVLDAGQLAGAEAIVTTIDTGGAHHGVAVALEEQGVVVATTPVEGEALPNGVALFDIESGAELERFDDCPGLHGEASVDALVAFGCDDGVLLLEAGDDGWTSTKIDRPAGTDEELRTGTLVAGDDPASLVGNLGNQALVHIDTVANEATTIPLPEPMVSFVMDAARDAVVVVTIDGYVHRIDPVSGAVLQSVAVLDPFALPEGHGGPPTPALTVAGDRAYLTDPTGGTVVELGIVDELRIARELEVGGTPASVTVAGV